MTVAQAATLETLAREGEMRLGALGRRLGIAPSTLTRNLTRLEDGGLVERRSAAGDRRTALAALTRRGRSVAARIEASELRFAESVLERLPPGRREPVVAALGELLDGLRAATERCCPGAYDHLMRDLPRSAAEGGNCDAVPGCCD
jgi:DNA-binding MarR family transcriptional regulator